MRVAMTPSVTAYAAITILFAVFGVILYASGALVFDGTEQSAKIVTATLALVAAFVASVVSVFGILIKHSIDVRTEARQQLDSERNAVLAREAEDRLRLDTVIRTIQLFGHEGAKALPVQRAGALIALCSLGQHELAISLAADLLVRGDLEAATAAAVIDRAITGGQPHVKVVAADLFFEHANKLLTKASYEIPHSFFHFEQPMPFPVRQGGVLGLIKLLLARPLKQWRDHHRVPAFGLVMALVRAWRSELDEELKINTASVLREVLEAFGDTTTFRDATETVDLVTIRAELSETTPSASNIIQGMVGKLREWRAV